MDKEQPLPTRWVLLQIQMTFLAAHAPDGLLAPGGLLGTSHRFLFKIGGRNTTNPPSGGTEGALNRQGLVGVF